MAVSVALADHLEDIVMGSYPSLGEGGRRLLRDLLHRYKHVFPAPGEPVTGRTTSVQHEIQMSDARPVRCGPRRLVPCWTSNGTDLLQDLQWAPAAPRPHDVIEVGDSRSSSRVPRW